MCGGSRVKTADEYYEEMKPPPVELPSLRAGDKVDRKTSYKDVKPKKTGVQRRSLLSFFGSGSEANK